MQPAGSMFLGTNGRTAGADRRGNRARALQFLECVADDVKRGVSTGTARRAVSRRIGHPAVSYCNSAAMAPTTCAWTLASLSMLMCRIPESLSMLMLESSPLKPGSAVSGDPQPGDGQ